MNVDKNSVFMLKCIFCYSENKSSSDTARRILLGKSLGKTDDEEKAKRGYYGSFMSAVCGGDYLEAFRMADMKNRAALKEGTVYLANSHLWLMYGDLLPADYMLDEVHKGEE